VSPELNAVIDEYDRLLEDPDRFSDPARFSIAHGGKDRHPASRAIANATPQADGTAGSRTADAIDGVRTTLLVRGRVTLASQFA
jgi:hypothetical protein